MTITNKTQAVAQLRAAADRLEDFEGELPVVLVDIYIHEIPAEMMPRVLLLADEDTPTSEHTTKRHHWHGFSIGGAPVAAFYETWEQKERRMSVCS